MSLVRALLHGFALTFADIMAIVGGFALWQFLRDLPQRTVQIPAAALLAVALYLVWTRFTRRALPAWALRERPDYARAYIAAFFWNPVLFSLIHYLTQGYRTDPGNLMALAWFQLPVNFIALQAAMYIGRK